MQLGRDVLLEIFSFSKEEDLLCLVQINTYFKGILNENFFFQRGLAQYGDDFSKKKTEECPQISWKKWYFHFPHRVPYEILVYRPICMPFIAARVRKIDEGNDSNSIRGCFIYNIYKFTSDERLTSGKFYWFYTDKDTYKPVSPIFHTEENANRWILIFGTVKEGSKKWKRRFPYHMMEKMYTSFLP